MRTFVCPNSFQDIKKHHHHPRKFPHAPHTQFKYLLGKKWIWIECHFSVLMGLRDNPYEVLCMK